MNDKTIKEIRQLFKDKKLTDYHVSQLRQDKRKGVQTIVTAFEREQENHQQLVNQFSKMSQIEKQYRSVGNHYIAGVDEAGRGPLAGPVVAAAVILPDQFELLGLTDSKQLKREQRDEFFNIIKKEAVCYHIAMINNNDIDEINIYEATKRAMTEALIQLDPSPDIALVDAMKIDGLPFTSRSIVKGDEKSISIAAASVLAKVTRDRLMEEIDAQYPIYRFKTNMGYGTKEHLQKIEMHGISPYHRRSFAPVKRLISGGDG